MTDETKHILKWQKEWFLRFIRTTYHLFNRKAYRKWKKEFAAQKAKDRRAVRELWDHDPLDFCITDMNEFH